MKEKPSFIKRLFSITWRIINTIRKTIVNLVFFSLLLVFIAVISTGGDQIKVPEQTALVLNLKGDLVEQKKEIDPVDAFMNEAFGSDDEPPEILMADVIDTLATAKDDDRVKLLVLQLANLRSGGLTKLRDIAAAIEDFKSSGKRVIAIGDNFTQDQYYLASHADDVWLNPRGFLLLDGYGRYRMYFKSALDKLKISQHIFRVGTFKSAVEPFMRDDMSPAAKEANEAWLSDLWRQYKDDVANQREFDTSNFDESANALLAKLESANGNFAEYALANHWVDALKSREAMRQDIIALVGKNDKGDNFSQIGFTDYLAATKLPQAFENPVTDKVAVVVAKGNILDGNQSPGTIGGDSTAKLLRKARYNDKVKAVVLRVDSPGGSAYASEIIRQEIELLKEAGKPVIASMGTYAASGGYWISASANKIYAAPTTITGSIGIFGLLMTFENSLASLGIHADGVGTTDIAGFSPARGLSDDMGRVIQVSVNRGYQDFISLVAENRNMTLEQVDAIAQGRVWTGRKAQELGLVDELGNLADAISAAADIAGLSQYDTLLIEKELSARDKFLRDLLGQSFAAFNFNLEQTSTTTPVGQLMSLLGQSLNELKQFNDPQGIYSFCLTCQIN